ncbi:ADM2 [Austrofundulus limnaeus]|uniref:ADM2 n=1 Tax=Austrofundulus limnaeus TaxID=52670 RepID=A0A2I4ATV6_AUSLI|nr:PREDICTED: ADM2 [Austrofundulus limnaeus]
MCAPPLVWLCLLLGLLPLKVQARALTAQRAHRDRLIRTSEFQKPSDPDSFLTASDPPAATRNRTPERVWRAPPHKDPAPRSSEPLLYGNRRLQLQAPVWQRASRGRRHASGSGARAHGHLMRVGCVLGTCQVQNLSHRLYQLIGQSGRVESSPLNLHSPHSYG